MLCVRSPCKLEKHRQQAASIWNIAMKCMRLWCPIIPLIIHVEHLTITRNKREQYELLAVQIKAWKYTLCSDSQFTYVTSARMERTEKKACEKKSMFKSSDLYENYTECCKYSCSCVRWRTAATAAITSTESRKRHNEWKRERTVAWMRP